MNDFKAEPAELLAAELDATQRVLKSGWFILGKEVETFEKEWAAYCGANVAVGVGNGMDAIEIGLRALDIGPGDEVITTGMTAIATVAAIVRTGATPVLADIDPQTALLDVESVQRCITAKTKAIVLVHLYGDIRDVETMASLCKAANIHLVEDCAQAHGARWKGRLAGTFGTFGAFSFYPTKNLGARGDGGAIVGSSDAFAARVRILRNYGQQKRYHHSEFGMNSRLDELQAAILSVRLKWLDRFNARRQQIAQFYVGNLMNSKIQVMARPQSYENHVYHLFVVRTAERDRLAQFLKEQGIESLVHYPIPVHRQSCGTELRLDPAGLHHTESHAAECLSIPCHPQLRDSDVEKMVETLNRF